ncbi:MAG: wax ester/triacylglycerol synthase family O-acyltransferase [Saprospiraceae bacterium]|nr:wax ester/triacylglycerol synthase family O-acyltransferase [Bacteroidia bacterium]NNE14463.1 wax ester/triacylglycerol synthase family O-acyltransferase [Saprospiraceae bacterium]NNL93022.1 wax ester/triacylglycerol synthase family O-acyltransferase [Saprospiraceae bacterium]
MIDKVIDQFDLSDLESVSGLDATFLYGETPTSPMHVGSVAVIEGSLEYETFKKVIHSRIHQVPKLRKRLMTIPFKIDYPYWVDDPHFNIEMHLSHVALPKPGDWKALRKMASRIFSEPLDQSRPLWSFTFVEGLDNLSQVKPGSVAIISKIHHVAIDGVAGAGLLGILFDMSPEKQKIKPPREYNPKPLPNELGLMLKSGISFAKSPLKFPKLISSAFEATLKAGFFTRAQHLDLPTAPFTAPSTPLNGIISAQRKWNTSILSLERVKALKKIMGTTLNDIVLSICSGALRRYLLEKKQLPKKPMVAMVPISTRKESDGQSGNQLSAMLIQLATDIEDPIERLETIYENTIRGKTYQGAMGAKSLANLAGAVPFGIANQAARLYSRFNLAKMHNPVFNVVITNVPGPQMPIYLDGNKMHSIMGMAPIIDGMGLIITVLSYNGNITISPTSDVNSMPDLNKFSRYILESANDLEKAILDYDKEGKQKKIKAGSKTLGKKAKAESDEYFELIRKYLKSNPKFIKKEVGLFQFFVKGQVASDWQVNLLKAPGTIRKGRAKKFDASLTIQDKHLIKIAQGKLDVMTAFIQGRIAITGDNEKVMKLASILKKLPKVKT